MMVVKQRAGKLWFDCGKHDSIHDVSFPIAAVWACSKIITHRSQMVMSVGLHGFRVHRPKPILGLLDGLVPSLAVSDKILITRTIGWVLRFIAQTKYTLGVSPWYTVGVECVGGPPRKGTLRSTAYSYHLDAVELWMSRSADKMEVNLYTRRVQCNYKFWLSVTLSFAVPCINLSSFFWCTDLNDHQ